jgi:hypothetical protein
VSLDVVNVFKGSWIVFRLYAMEGKSDAASDGIVDTIEIYRMKYLIVAICVKHINTLIPLVIIKNIF